AAATGLALVAGLSGVVEVRTARALQKIAGCGRLMAQLRRCTGNKGAVLHAVVASHTLVGGGVSVAHECGYTQAAFRGGFELVECEIVDVDEMRRRFDLQLHQIEQVGAAGDELCALVLRRGGRSFRRRLGALVGEGFHALPPPKFAATSAIASWMLEYAPQRQM